MVQGKGTLLGSIKGNKWDCVHSVIIYLKGYTKSLLGELLNWDLRKERKMRKDSGNLICLEEKQGKFSQNSYA